MTIEARDLYRKLKALAGIRALMPGVRPGDLRSFAAAVERGDARAEWHLQVAFGSALCEAARHYAIWRVVQEAHVNRGRCRALSMATVAAVVLALGAPAARAQGFDAAWLAWEAPPATQAVTSYDVRCGPASGSYTYPLVAVGAVPGPLQWVRADALVPAGAAPPAYCQVRGRTAAGAVSSWSKQVTLLPSLPAPANPRAAGSEPLPAGTAVYAE